MTLWYKGENKAVDSVVFWKKKSNEIQSLKVLLIKRGDGTMALPGGFIDENEEAIHAAVRELNEETNLIIKPESLVKTGYYDSRDRDPRNDEHSYVSSTAFSGIIHSEEPVKIKAESDAVDVKWVNVTYLLFPEITNTKNWYADHEKIFNDAFSFMFHLIPTNNKLFVSENNKNGIINPLNI